LAKSLAAAVKGSFRRVQFTPDLLPADLVGYSLYRQDRESFEFIEGPVFTNLLLADEINRTSPRIQSALLECMNESQVSVDGITRDLPDVFQVIATRNLRHGAGTFPLPAPQLDRFLISVSMSLPNRETRADILQQHADDPTPRHGDAGDESAGIVDLAALLSLQDEVRNIPVSTDISHYIVRLCDAIRAHSEIDAVISNRGAIAIMRFAQAIARIENHEAVFPDDVKRAFVPCVFHRLLGDEGEFGQDESNRRSAALRMLLEELRESISVE
jgi:MoxR-like ATPase